MLINPDKKWIYVGPPRTASSMLHEYLSKQPFNGRFDLIMDFDHAIPQHSTKLPKYYDESWTIIYSVRHPYTRTVSMWQLQYGNSITFEDYIKLIPLNIKEHFMFRTVASWTKGLQFFPNSYAIRQESILEDLKQVPVFANLEFPLLPIINASEKASGTFKLSQNLLDIISNYYKEDIETWYANDGN